MRTRTEKDMFDLILGVARADDRIRAVYLNGSRTNPNAPKDIFQDYDLVFVVDQIEPFRSNKQWISVFGDPLIIQLPYEMDQIMGHTVDFSRHYTYLMQFTDGNRIDLTLLNQEQCMEEFLDDKLTVVLLDKDGVLPPIPPPSDDDYRVQKPTQGLFDCCCNEFWWMSLYVAKGLWRDEILYAMDNLNDYLRPQLLIMVSWYAGLLHDFAISVGKCGKYLDQFLPESAWQQLLTTYPEANVLDVWIALDHACQLFDTIGREIGQALDLAYPSDEAGRCRDYLARVRALPRDASSI